MSRLKALLGPQSAPTSLGLLFVLSLVHELSHARTDEAVLPNGLADLQPLLDNEADLQKIVEIIQDTYPEIAGQLFGDQDLLRSEGAFDVAAVADELATLESSGYLGREEALRLTQALKAVSGDTIVAQAATESAATEGAEAAQAGAEAAEGAAGAAGAGAEELAVDIEALPATGAGPAAFAIGPLAAGGGAVAAVAATGTTKTTTSTADTTAPSAPTFALTVDTGKSATDGITSDGRVTVSGLESGATWQYSTNGGTSWTTGSGSSFTLAANTYAASAIQVRQTDAAGNTSSVANNGSAITVDTTAASMTGVAAHSASKTIVLTYDSVLDTTNKAAITDFVVTTAGANNAVTNVAVAVSGSTSTVTLTLTNAFTAGDAVTVKYTDPAGDAANAIQDLAGNDSASFNVTTGVVADGYVRGAQIYIDANNNGLPEDSEILEGYKTDENGNFFLPTGTTGTILAVGGFNIDTGIANTVVFKAPSGSTMITPLTTLVQAYKDANPTASIESANAAVLAALNLPTTINLASYDPLAVLEANPSSAEALAVQRMAAKVATVVQLAAESPNGVTAQVAGNSVIANLVSQVSTAATNGTQVDLTSTSTLTAVLGTTTSADLTAAFNATTAIGNASSLTAVSNAQSQALDKTPPAAPTLALTSGSDSGTAGDGITNTASPVVRVSFNTSATDGTAVVAGNTLKLYKGGVLADTIELTSTQISNGYVDIALSGVSGTNALTATITDKGQAGFNVSPTSSTFSLTVDTSVATPTLMFTDTGSSGSDGITNNGTVTVSGIESGATWQYSTNNGTDWATGSGNSFALTGDGAKSVLVRQTDVAGNTATSSALNFTLDTTAPAVPTINTVAGNNAVDHAEATSGSGITVTGTAPAGSNLSVIWGATRFDNVAVNGSGVWSVNFTAAQVPADGNTSIVARASDAAGNVSTGMQAVAISTSRTDTTRPDTPLINNVAADNTVNAAEKSAGVVVSGTAEPDSTVAVNWGGTIQNVKAAADGSWSTTFASGAIPANGSSTITATARDIAGNESLVPASRSVTIDTTPPVAPTLAITDTGSSASDGITSNRTVTVGNLEGGATWQYSLDSGSTWTTGSGSSFTLAANTTYASGAIQVRQTDGAGNISPTATRAVTVDNTAPNAPVINAVATDNIVNSSEKTAGVAVSGTAEAGSSVAVTWGSTTQTVTAAANGTWTTTFSNNVVPADGSRPITAIATDAAGNASASASRAVSVDTSGPAAPTLTTANTAIADSLINVAERSAGVTLSGTAEIGSTLTLNWGSLTKTVTVGATGNWTTTVASADLPASGSTISLTARDAAGNPGATYTSSAITIAQIGSNASNVLLADITSPTYAGFDSLTLAANQTRTLTATEYLSSDFTAALAKITNPVSAYTLNVTGVQAADLLTIGARANVDSITLAPSQSISLTSADYSANATALGKIQTASSDYTLTVTGVTAANALSVIGDSKVDNIQLASNQTLTLSLSQYNSNSSAASGVGLGKITTDPASYTLNLTGVTASDFVGALTAAGADTRIDGIALANAQTINLTAADYLANSAGLAKITTPVDGYTLNVSGVTAANLLSIAGNSKVDGVTLDSGQTLNLTAADYNANSTALGKITTAPANYTLNVSGVNAANALTVAGDSKVDQLTVIGATSDNFLSVAGNAKVSAVQLASGQTLNLTQTQYLDAANTAALGKISNTVSDYVVNVSGVTAANALSIGAQANVDGISLAASQTLALSAADYSANTTVLGKINSAPADFTLDVTGASSANALTIGADSRVDHVTLISGQSFNLSGGDFDAASGAFAKITNATTDYSVTVNVQAGTTAGDLIAHGNAGGYIDVLDLADNGLTLTDAQATALVQAGLHFAADDSAVVLNSSVHAAGTHLTTSLSSLQNLGVDTINVSGTAGNFVISAGADSISGANLPTVHAASGVTVGLEVTDSVDAASLVSNAGALSAKGFEAIMAADGSLTFNAPDIKAIHDGGLVFNQADEITMRIGTSVEGTAINNLVTAINNHVYPHDLDVLDVVDNNISLTDAQASSLVSAGLHFAADDTGVTVQAAGTHLSTSLSDLQKLGVDAISVSGLSGTLGIAVGDNADFAHLPTVSAHTGLVVGLEIPDNAFDGTSLTDIANNAAALKNHGFDALMAADGSLSLDSSVVETVHTAGLVFDQVDAITMQIQSSAESSAISNLVGTIGTPNAYHHDLDILNVVDNAIDLSDAQAHSLVSAGLHFAADDTGVAVHAAGTHLTTSLTDLQHLGVDYVHTDAGVHTVVVDLGSGDMTSNILPVFDAQDNVTLKLADTQLGGLIDLLHTPGGNDPHIDNLSITLNNAIGHELTGAGVLDTALDIFQVELNASYADSAVTLGMILDAADGTADPLSTLHGHDLVTALQANGISNINIDAITSFEVTDSDMKALMDAGKLTAAAGAHITVDNNDGSLDATLAQLANIGADHVATLGGSTLDVDLGVTVTDGTSVHAALSDIIAAFEAQHGGTLTVANSVFDQADTVDLHVGATLSSYTLDDATVTKLGLLGIDDVLDADGHSIKPHTPT